MSLAYPGGAKTALRFRLAVRSDGCMRENTPLHNENGRKARHY